MVPDDRDRKEGTEWGRQCIARLYNHVDRINRRIHMDDGFDDY